MLTQTEATLLIGLFMAIGIGGLAAGMSLAANLRLIVGERVPTTTSVSNAPQRTPRDIIAVPCIPRNALQAWITHIRHHGYEFVNETHGNGAKTCTAYIRLPGGEWYPPESP